MMRRAWGDIVDLLEWRSQRLDREDDGQSDNQQYNGADKVIHTSDLSALGIKDVSDRG